MSSTISIIDPRLRELQRELERQNQEVEGLEASIDPGALEVIGQLTPAAGEALADVLPHLDRLRPRALPVVGVRV